MRRSARCARKDDRQTSLSRSVQTRESLVGRAAGSASALCSRAPDRFRFAETKDAELRRPSTRGSHPTYSDSADAPTVTKSEPELTLKRRAESLDLFGDLHACPARSVPSLIRCDIMSLRPGRSGGSFESPPTNAKRKLTIGRRVSLTTRARSSLASVSSIGAGMFSGRDWSGGGL